MRPAPADAALGKPVGADAIVSPLMTQLDRSQILAYRYHATGLNERRPNSEIPAAARPGLQDGSPHSGVISLHARVEGIAAADWTRDSLTQVWGPRGAIYLISKEDLAVFTLGLLPRDDDELNSLHRQARRVLRMLDGRPQSPRAILEAIPNLASDLDLRRTSATGWFLPIWDANATAVYPAEPADVEVEASRLELGRRFLHYLGPATTEGFQWWSGCSQTDAIATMRALGPELATVDVDRHEALMLADDVAAAEAAERPQGIQLLPPEDVYISRLCGPLLVRDKDLYRRLYPRAPLPGALIVDGEVAAVWRRRARHFTVSPFPRFDVDAFRSSVTAAAAELPLPGEPEETTIDWYFD